MPPHASSGSRPKRRACFPAILGLALACGVACSGPRAEPGAFASGWRAVPDFEMKGGLTAFWNVGEKLSRAHEEAALARGFKPMSLLNTYADYPGGQKENISKALTQPANPWRRPAFFERTVRRNLDQQAPTGPYVLDIEIPIEPPSRAWSNGEIRQDSGVADEQAFADAYARQWKDWYALPVQWTKARYPNVPVGIYGLQPFWYDYWGFIGHTRGQLERKHEPDLTIWREIDPYVDFYTVTTYAFYDRPDSVLAIAANVEENYLRARELGNKPVYAYTWLRFHDQNKQIGGQEVTPYLAEAMAIVPYFSGAKGVVLWGWEPQLKADDPPPYRNLPLFTASLARVAALSERIGRGRLVIDKPAQEVWNARKPLVRTVVAGPDECVVMAINPWQDDEATRTTPVTCAGRSYDAPLRGKHTTLLLISAGRATEY